ncbi:hypothetical protein GCM10022226_82530 [Sphaerisporangium flaviroseum]|uniref:DUF1275 domain-containing protein n=2 Tax=Sphaerisporangium flaviroseum TaxID=509199 RepID=A0ABP7JJH5_9ACTN
MTLTRRAGPDPLPMALLVLTVLSGSVDAVSYLGLGHVFTANMTGNVVILGFAAVGTPGFSATASLISLLAFLAGAVVAGRLDVHLRSRRLRILTTLAVQATVLTLAAAAAAVLGPPTLSGRYAVIALVAVAMGLQNGTVRLLAVPDMTTTVLTRTLTGLASESSLAGGTNAGAVRRIASVLCLLTGAGLGALALRGAGVAGVLLGLALAVTLTAAGYAAHPGSRRP